MEYRISPHQSFSPPIFSWGDEVIGGERHSASRAYERIGMGHVNDSAQSVLLKRGHLSIHSARNFSTGGCVCRWWEIDAYGYLSLFSLALVNFRRLDFLIPGRTFSGAHLVAVV